MESLADEELAGPGKYLVGHPVAYAASLVGASWAAAIFATRAGHSRGAKRIGWAALAVLELAIFLGILSLRRSQAPLADRSR